MSDYVFDGDTLRLRDGRKLRLIGIDTPEIGRDGAPSQPFSRQAQALLERIAAPGTRLALSFGSERLDRYGRLLAHAFPSNGPSLQEQILEHGLATTFIYPPNVSRAGCYAAVERRAQQDTRGIWSLPAYRPVAAAKLSRRARGYRVVTGKIERVGSSRSALWLNLGGSRFAVRVPRRDLAYFEPPPSAALTGRRIEARGLVYRQRGELRMTVRHPAALQLLD